MTREEKIARVEKIQKAQAILDRQIKPAAQEPETDYLGMAGTALDKTMKGLDYPRAALGGPLMATAIEKLSGEKVIQPGEYEDALKMKGNYPNTAEMLSRAHVLDEHPWVREGAGLVGDIASDPTTLFSLGAKKLAEKGMPGLLGKLANLVHAGLNPVEVFNKYRSDKNYAKAFERLDKAAVEQGKTVMPSKILKDSSFSGNMSAAADRLEEINKAAGENIGAALKQATDEGVRVNLPNLFMPSLNYIAELKQMPVKEAHELADQIRDKILFTMKQAGASMSPEEATQAKSFINNLVKDSGFAQGAEAAIGTKARKTISEDLAKGIPEDIAKVNAPLAKELVENNKLYASTAPSIRDLAERLGRTAPEMRSFLTPTAVDLMLLGGGAGASYLGGGSPVSGGLMAFGAKKIGQSLMSTAGRSTRGRIGKALGNIPMNMGSRVAQRGLWDMVPTSDGKERSPQSIGSGYYPSPEAYAAEPDAPTLADIDPRQNPAILDLQAPTEDPKLYSPGQDGPSAMDGGEDIKMSPEIFNMIRAAYQKRNMK